MSNVVGLVVFGVGVSLLIINFAVSKQAGIQSSTWAASHPGLRSIWLLLIGSFAVIAGLFLAFWGEPTEGVGAARGDSFRWSAVPDSG